jgi:hypothetical protein
MYIVVKNLTKLKTPQTCHGKTLAHKARECFLKNELLTLDFEGVETIAAGFFHELILPMVSEFGADFLKSKLQVTNICPDVEAIMQSAFKNLDDYFDKLTNKDHQICDQELYDLNLSWLVKAREIARESAVQAQLILGIADEEMRIAISKMSMEDMQAIARSGCLCFAPRFTTNFIQSMTTKRHDLVDMLLALISWF